MPTPLTLTFVPEDLDCADFGQLEPLFEALLSREIETEAALKDWLRDYSELSSVVREYGSRRNIDHACHTDDDDIEKAYLHWVQDVAPKLSPLYFALSKKYLASPARAALEASDERFRMLGRSWEAEVEVYREANIPLFTRLSELNLKYDKMIGAMEVEYDGQTYTLQQLAKFQQDADRSVRQATWELSSARRLEDREAIGAVFEDMLKVRAELARNADEPDFRAFQWKQFERFDYSPQDCLDFGDAVEAVVVPRVRELDERRRERLGVDTLRPWDTAVDPEGGAPLRPFEADDVEKLVSGGQEIFRRVWPPLADAFGTMQMGRNLDLKSRRGKRAGGFQASLPRVREPFIFMNAAGLQRDVDTLLHEGGHAFHYLWANQAEELMFLHHAPLEFCEVASMSMELLGCDHYGVFYETEAEARRAKRKQLEGVLRVLPWIATIDGFQHWLYTHEGHSPDERTAAWLDVFGRFSTGVVDYDGYAAQKESRWQAQGHLFHVPFYYIEYGIAQLGAMQLWLKYQADPAGTLELYREALTLGGTRPLPELFEAAGIRFAFDRQTVEPLVDALMTELEAVS